MKPALGEITVKPGESLGERLRDIARYFGDLNSPVLVQVYPTYDGRPNTYLFRVPETGSIHYQILKKGEREDAMTEVFSIGDDELMRLFLNEGSPVKHTEFDAEIKIRGRLVKEIKRPLQYEAGIISGQAAESFLSKYVLNELGI
jgi:hypothetical protein